MNKEASFDFNLPKVWVQEIHLTKYENSLIFISFLQEFLQTIIKRHIAIGNRELYLVCVYILLL